VPPQLTVVIPAWDSYAGDGLLEALASVRSQAVPVEVIVVDNASEVPLPGGLGSAEIVALEQRRSTGAARNAGLERVRTPYVVFLDADDLLVPGALSALLNGLEANADCSAYVCSIVDGVTGVRHRSPRWVARALCAWPRLFALANTIWSLLPTQGAAIMRTADVGDCGGYGDSDRGEDWVLGVSLAFRGRVTFDRRPGLCYRRRADSPGEAAIRGPVLLENARRVRARVREDQAIPGWAKSALPLIAAGQWAAARIAYPALGSLRELVHLIGLR
jgi:glycosyltransferase involved in cell wall biosynthesis